MSKPTAAMLRMFRLQEAWAEESITTHQHASGHSTKLAHQSSQCMQHAQRSGAMPAPPASASWLWSAPAVAEHAAANVERRRPHLVGPYRLLLCGRQREVAAKKGHRQGCDRSARQWQRQRQAAGAAVQEGSRQLNSVYTQNGRATSLASRQSHTHLTSSLAAAES